MLKRAKKGRRGTGAGDVSFLSHRDVPSCGGKRYWVIEVDKSPARKQDGRSRRKTGSGLECAPTLVACENDAMRVLSMENVDAQNNTSQLLIRSEAAGEHCLCLENALVSCHLEHIYSSTQSGESTSTTDRLIPVMRR